MSSEPTNGKTSQAPHDHAGTEHTPSLSGKLIGIRLLYTILFLFILGIVVIIAKVVVAFQFIYLFITRETNDSVRRFSNQISTYGYRVLRYITLNENRRPFPFTDFSPELEPPDEPVTFD